MGSKGFLRSWRRPKTQLVSALLLFLACSGDGPTEVGAEANGTVVVLSLGSSLDIVLGNVGPGTYVSPPEISGDALEFLSAEIVPPYTPGGPTQRFQFRAEGRGTSHIAISKTDNAGVVHSNAYALTVEVR